MSGTNFYHFSHSAKMIKAGQSSHEYSNEQSAKYSLLIETIDVSEPNNEFPS